MDGWMVGWVYKELTDKLIVQKLWRSKFDRCILEISWSLISRHIEPPSHPTIPPLSLSHYIIILLKNLNLNLFLVGPALVFVICRKYFVKFVVFYYPIIVKYNKFDQICYIKNKFEQTIYFKLNLDFRFNES